MNTTLLRASKRYANGCRSWVVPGAPNRARLVPGSQSMWPGHASFSWPFQETDGHWIMRTVRLDWHRSIARQAIRDIIARGQQ